VRPAATISSAQPSGAARKRPVLRVCLRTCRITVVVLAFIVVVTGFFLNKIGLPDFVKDRLVAQIRANGWDVEFSRIRLRYRGIVADDLHLRRTNTINGPNLFVPRAECGLNFSAFTKLKLDVKSFAMNGARFAGVTLPYDDLILIGVGDAVGATDAATVGAELAAGVLPPHAPAMNNAVIPRARTRRVRIPHLRGCRSAPRATGARLVIPFGRASALFSAASRDGGVRFRRRAPRTWSAAR